MQGGTSLEYFSKMCLAKTKECNENSEEMKWGKSDIEDLKWSDICHLNSTLSEFCCSNTQYTLLSIDYVKGEAILYNTEEKTMRKMEYASCCRGWM